MGCQGVLAKDQTTKKITRMTLEPGSKKFSTRSLPFTKPTRKCRWSDLGVGENCRRWHGRALVSRLSKRYEEFGKANDPPVE